MRERSSAEVRSTVIDDQSPFVALVVPRVSGELTELRTPTTGVAGKLFQAVGVALPPNLRELSCCAIAGITTGVMARSRSTISRASTSRPIWA